MTRIAKGFVGLLDRQLKQTGSMRGIKCFLPLLAIILTGPDLGPKEAAIYLTNNGISEITPAIVCKNLALSDEKISRGTLQDMAAKQFSWRSVMIVI